MNTKFLECWRVRKQFKTDRGPFVAVGDFTINVAEGEFVSIIGHSGCGKSTVLMMIAGLHSIDGGGLVLDNQEIQSAGPDRAVVFQSPNLLPWLTALENVQIAVDQVCSGTHYLERKEIALHWLDRVGLADTATKKPGELSQGMQQRIGIARAFALQPKLLLLDEPFGMLDSLTRIELQDVLLDVWNTQKITTLMVTHDVDEAVLLSDRIIMMTNGPAATIGKIECIPMARPRNRESAPSTHPYLERRESVLHFLQEADLSHAGAKES